MIDLFKYYAVKWNLDLTKKLEKNKILQSLVLIISKLLTKKGFEKKILTIVNASLVNIIILNAIA